MNVEVNQDHINQKYQTNFWIPVVYYSTLMIVACGGSGKVQASTARSSRPNSWKRSFRSSTVSRQ
jgi:heterodisulfide reductase subunit B